MQDIHSVGGGGRLSGAGGNGDRRIRPYHHQNHQALKCPRCDSPNTKFCYYNNYNLSQPRHFCKSCRRYWTKGGVLRNVPVGGGCRKTKRSKPKQNNPSSSPDNVTAAESSTATAAPTQEPPRTEVLNPSNSHSSSESSSLTATNTATNANTAMEEVSALSSSNHYILSGTINTDFETGLLEQGTSSDCGIFSEIGSFTSLITPSNDLSFGFANVLNQQNHLEQVHGQNHQQWLRQQKTVGLGGAGEDMTIELLDQTVQAELSALNTNDRAGTNGGFGALDDWQGAGGGDHQGLFDLPDTVDQAYWSQSQSQWTDQDHPNLFLP